MDVCGPLQVTTAGGARYLSTFIDDYSRLSHVIPLAQKSEVASAVREVTHLLENQSGKRLKAVRTDKGTEYVNSELQGYFRDKGVVHNTTAPYTPEQNGVAERFNRTRMDRVRAMLLDAKLELDYWAEAARTATYVKNMSPSSGSAQTPWELFYGRKPDISGMRVFGAKAYVHVPKQLRRKLDSLSKAGTFIGYVRNSKAYRVLMDSGKIEISRDVIFVESMPTAAAREAPAEAEETNTEVSIMVPTIEEAGSEVGSEGIDVGPTYETDSEASEEATQEAEPAAEETAATSLTVESSAQESEQARYPQRQRKPPTQIYQAQAAKATEFEEPQNYEEAMKAPDRNRQARTLKMTQERLATELVSRYGMKEGKTKSVPMITSVKLVQATEGNMLDKEAYRYSELVGSLLYLSVCTRPDISQAVGVLTRHMAQPSMEQPMDSSQGISALHSRHSTAWHTVWTGQSYSGGVL